MKSWKFEVTEREAGKISVDLLGFWRNCEIATAFFAVCSMVCATIDYEKDYSPSRDYKNCDQRYKNDTEVKWITFGCSFAGIICVLIGTYSKYQWEDYLKQIDTTFQYKRTKRLFLTAALEVTLLLIFPYPSLDFEVQQAYGKNLHYLNICYNFCELTYSVMWLRFYFLVKIIVEFSQYIGNVSRRATLENKVKYGTFFAFKCLFKSRPMMMIFICIGFPTIIVAGMMVRVYERPLIHLSNQDWENPFTAIWFINYAMMVGGHAEFKPLSEFGRLVTIISYVIGTLFFVMIFVNVQNQTYLTRRQRKAFNDISVIRDAADVIKASIKYYIEMKNEGGKRDEAYLVLGKKVLKFGHKRRYLLDMPRQRDLDMMELMGWFRKQKKSMDRIHCKVEEAVHLINKKRALVN